MSIPYTPDFADAAQDAFAGQAFDDPGSSAYAAADPARVDAKYFLKPVQDEILALQAGRVASANYRRTWTCAGGLNAGDPVYVSANDTVTKADATTATKAQVIGFVRYKPTTTTCYIEHFRYVSGLSGGTAGAAVYLTDAGGFSASAGTVTKIVGQWITATEALLHASQMSALASGVTGGTTSFVPKFASATTLTLSAYGDDGTYGTLMAIGSSTFNETSTLMRWRGTTVPVNFTHASAGGTDLFFRAQSAFAGSGGNGANIYFMPGSADGAGTAGRFRVCLAGDDTKYIDLYKDAFGQAWFRNSENSKIIFTISGSNCFAINTSIDTGTADASQGSFGFWTCKSFFMGAAGASSDITVGRKGATILRLTAGAETDASTFLMASGTGSAPSAYTNSSDTAGKDCIFRTQSGGAHSAANPRGGNFAIHLGSKGAGGSGNNGEFLVYSPANSLNLLGCRSDRINRQDFWQYVTPSSGFTADATPTTINSLTLSDNYVYHIRVRVLGIRTDGTVRESHEFLLTAYRNGGGASIQDTTTVHAPAAPTWTVACATSGNDVQVNVTGTAHNINWFSEINYAQLSE